MIPTKDDEDWLSLSEAGYIGLDKPQVKRSVYKRSRQDITEERIDRQMKWARKRARELGLDPDEILHPDDWDNDNYIRRK